MSLLKNNFKYSSHTARWYDKRVILILFKINNITCSWYCVLLSFVSITWLIDNHCCRSSLSHICYSEHLPMTLKITGQKNLEIKLNQNFIVKYGAVCHIWKDIMRGWWCNMICSTLYMAACWRNKISMIFNICTWKN